MAQAFSRTAGKGDVGVSVRHAPAFGLHSSTIANARHSTELLIAANAAVRSPMAGDPFVSFKT